MKEFTITLRHDRGKINITTSASTKEQAIAQVLDHEGAPESAVVGVSYPSNQGDKPCSRT